MIVRRTELMAFGALILGVFALGFSLRPITPSAAETTQRVTTATGSEKSNAVQLAALPITFNYQGTLRNASGVLVNGTVTMTLSLYNTPVNGQRLFTETAQNVVVRDGLFTVLLGDQAGNAIGPQVLATLPLYIGVAVLPDSEMLPRQRIHPLPWAVNADFVGGLHADEIVPAGTLVAFAGQTPPTGWLLCDGREVARTDYPRLFGAIGTSWGVGNGSTTFKLPDFRGRGPIGAGQGVNGDLTNRILAQFGGEEKHILTVAEMPAHTHAVHDSNHTNTPANVDNIGLEYGQYDPGGGHTYPAGGDQPHNNMQPYVVVNFIIKY